MSEVINRQILLIEKPAVDGVMVGHRPHLAPLAESGKLLT